MTFAHLKRLAVWPGFPSWLVLTGGVDLSEIVIVTAEFREDFWSLWSVVCSFSAKAGEDSCEEPLASSCERVISENSE